MKKYLVLIILVVSMYFFGCRNQCPPLTISQQKAIEKEILQIIDKIYISIEKLEVDGYAIYLSSDEFLGFHTCWLKAPILTKEALVDSTKVWFNGRKKQEISNVKIKISVFSENIVLVDRLANWKISFTDDRVGDFLHNASFIFKKESSGWKIVHLDEWYTTL